MNKNVFRRYPDSYESIIIIATDTLNDPQTKALMVWMLATPREFYLIDKLYICVHKPYIVSSLLDENECNPRIWNLLVSVMGEGEANGSSSTTIFDNHRLQVFQNMKQEPYSRLYVKKINSNKRSRFISSF